MKNNEKHYGYEKVGTGRSLTYVTLEVTTPKLPISHLVHLMNKGEIDTIYYSPTDEFDQNNKSELVVPLLLDQRMVEAYGVVYKGLDPKNISAALETEYKRFDYSKIQKYKKVMGNEYGCGSLSPHNMVEFEDREPYNYYL